MQAAGGAEGLRSLVDSDLPKLLKHIFTQAKPFGTRVFSLGESKHMIATDDSHHDNGYHRAQPANIVECAAGAAIAPCPVSRARARDLPSI